MVIIVCQCSFDILYTIYIYIYMYFFLYQTANEPIGRALCIGDGITQSQWQPVDNCGPFRNVAEILTEIAQVFGIFFSNFDH